ncbi:MAG: galactose-1-phosphate uridylyltransferase [bacterium]
MSELRRDPIVGRWVVISTERGAELSDYFIKKCKVKEEFCNYCAGNEGKTPPEIMAYRPQGGKTDKKPWDLRVIPNKFPALLMDGSMNRIGDGMYDKMDGIGTHEVIIETPQHSANIYELPGRKVEDIIWAYRDRIIDLKKDNRLEYVLIFKNHGVDADAPQSHTHSQLIATPVVPKKIKEEMKGAKSYYEYKERCVFCDMIHQEKRDQLRVVFENIGFLAFEPFASRYPFETWVLPKIHASNFENIQKKEVEQLADIMKEINHRISKALNDPPYCYMLHNTPVKENNLIYYHWHIEIVPKLKNTQGFEWGSSFYINTTSPEESAKFLRGVV